MNEESQEFDAFLFKPVNIKRLLSLLQEHLDLKWEYEESMPETGEKHAESPESDMAVPPPEELQSLYEIANTGLMERVVEHAEAIERSDSRYTDFVHQVKQLARDFEDEKLVNFLKRKLSREKFPE